MKMEIKNGYDKNDIISLEEQESKKRKSEKLKKKLYYSKNKSGIKLLEKNW